MALDSIATGDWPENWTAGWNVCAFNPTRERQGQPNSGQVQHRNRVSSILSAHSLVSKTRALSLTGNYLPAWERTRRYLSRFLPSLGPSSGSARDVQVFPAVLLNSFGLVHPLAERASLDINGLDVRTGQPVELDGSVAAH